MSKYKSCSEILFSFVILVTRASKEVDVPITCKIRVFEDIDKTVKYAQMLEAAGCRVIFFSFSLMFLYNSVYVHQVHQGYSIKLSIYCLYTFEKLMRCTTMHKKSVKRTLYRDSFSKIYFILLVILNRRDLFIYCITFL